MTSLEAATTLQSMFPDRVYWRADECVTIFSGETRTEYRLAIQPGLDSACDILSAPSYPEALALAAEKWVK